MNKQAQKIYDEMKPDVAKQDLHLLEQLALALARCKEAQEVIDELGMMLPTTTGFPRANPALQIQKNAIGDALKIAKALKLTAETREVLDDSGDDFSEFA